jgi:dTDP-4-dehydrorhamnose reductase
VGDEFRDQLDYADHYRRDADIDAVSSLSISSLRYPVLWERHQPRKDSVIDWSWSERQLSSLREKEITPIAGLLHHGSGPSFTNLLDPHFPEHLANYAESVATRFPWLTDYIPVNEPLTTARFSALYGYWYPHRQNSGDFAKALLNELKGTVLAMQKIRKVNGSARLVQTEDLTKIHSEPALQYQADFENHRRWLTFDILTGRLTPAHPMWSYFVSLGIAVKDLEFFIYNPCPPDLFGLNYYVTSERYLDSNIDQYEQSMHGGNGIHKYVDTEAVRVGKAVGISGLLEETWSRYRKPMAMTEIHIACTCDEQIRWFMEVWSACCEAREKGVDVKAITAWSLLGAYDWNSLLTRYEMNYECGAFDVSDGKLTLTDLGRAIKTLAESGQFQHDLLSSKGWWHQHRNEEHLVF